MSYPKQLVIAYGTGRCGSKSLAAFLNRQLDIEFTHEKAAIPFWPIRGGYREAVDSVMQYDAPIVGDVSPQWLMHINRLVEDFPNVKLIYLTRNNPQEVAKSFYSYLQHSNKRELFEDDCHGWYPVQERFFTVEAIHRSVIRYEWLAQVVQSYWGLNRLFNLTTESLNDETVQRTLLEWLGSEEPYDLYMPHINKRDWKIKETLRGNAKEGL